MRIEFPRQVREEIKIKQRNRCAVCGSLTHLSIHHKIPSSLAREYGMSSKQVRSIDNAVGVCRTPCHDMLDKKALDEHKFYPEVLQEVRMELGVQYTPSSRKKVIYRNSPT